MSDPKPAPKCSDKQGLALDVQLAMKVIIELTNRQIEAVSAGDLAKLEALDKEIAEAREWKDSMVESYRKHVIRHCC